MQNFFCILQNFSFQIGQETKVKPGNSGGYCACAEIRIFKTYCIAKSLFDRPVEECTMGLPLCWLENMLLYGGPNPHCCIRVINVKRERNVA